MINDKVKYAFVLMGITVMLCLPECCFQYEWDNMSSWRLVIIALMSICVSLLVLSICSRPARIITTCFLWLVSFAELLMVDTFCAYLTSGQLMAIVCANKSEFQMLFEYLWYRKSFWWILSFVGLMLALWGIGVKVKYKRNLIEAGVVFLSCVLFFVFTNIQIKDFFPCGLVHETGVVFSELNTIRNKKEASKGFKYRTNEMNEKIEDCVYVLAIGESLRYKNFALNQTYSRPTTPILSKYEDLTLFSNCYATATLTQHALPLILTTATPHNYDDHFAETGIGGVFSEAGYKTYFISNNRQLTNDGVHGYLVTHFDSVIYVPQDSVVVDELKTIVNGSGKRLVVLHFQGNHFFYANRSSDCEFWLPDIISSPYVVSDSLYINAYDNSVLYTDKILHKCIQSVNVDTIVSGLVFLSDHGDYVDKCVAVHGHTYHPTLDEYHVPLLVWCNNKYAATHPDKVNNAYRHKDEPICADHVFWSVLDMAGIKIDSTLMQEGMSIFGDTLLPHQRDLLLPDGKSILTL